jgi:putative transmembrane HD family protein
MLKKIFSRSNVIRAALFAAATAILVALVPRADHQSYSYELGQPWKYPLLTAELDIPIKRDSASIRAMRDSIDRAFVPFVKNDRSAADANITRFRQAMGVSGVDRKQTDLIAALMRQAYSQGIVDAKVYEIIHRQPGRQLRVDDGSTLENTVTTIDASTMLSPRKAFEFIDSAYNTTGSHLDAATVKAINVCLSPNVVLDTAGDSKYREQEYLNVDGALGMIKKGQRIVDRGEIVTSQIYTNLNTYQEALDKLQADTVSTYYFATGQTLYILLCFALLYLFLFIYRRSFFDDMRKMTFLMTFITLFIIFALAMFEYISGGLYLVPFAAVPVVTLIFFDSRTAIFSLLATVLIAAMVATYQFQFLFLQLLAGLVATFSIHQLSKRSQLLRTALFSFIAYVLGYLTMTLISEGNLEGFSWRMLGYFAVNGVILSFAYILIVIIEKIFGFTSTVTLVELSDINSPLLRRLAEEAPGTFQHSMQVSALAAEAARAIGANTQLVRTGALYHDIGKMESPIFFTENQHGVNPHAGLNPETSAQKIISHVTAGLQMASKAKLPSVIRDFIAEHHGRGLTKYFYNTAVNEAPEGTEVDRTKFMYPGPDPRSKETAIMMMADAVEAASRSLKDYSQESISNLVDRIVDQQTADGLFKESPISFKDVETVKETFKKRLATIYHSRIAYPELKKH